MPDQPGMEMEFTVFPSETAFTVGGVERPSTVFGPLAFEGQIGKEIPIQGLRCTLLAATVVPDGTSAVLRVRVPRAIFDALDLQIRPGDFSIAREESP